MADMSWYTNAYPELRDGPPWVMEEMVAAQPALAEEMLACPPAAADAIAEEIAAALAAGRPVTVTGCGTSEHGARGVAAILAGAVPASQRHLVRARPGLSAAIDPADGMCLAVSHGGGTRATALAVAAARRAGARSAAITNAPGAGAGAEADLIFQTPLHDDSYCHTVAYTSALLAGGILAARLGGPQVAPSAAGDLLRHAIGLDVSTVAEQLAGERIVLCAGAGVDHVTARELALKIAEGTRIPATAPELETVLHGQLVGHDDTDGFVLVAIHDGPEHDRLARRAGHVAQAVAAIGLPVAALLSPRYDRALAPELTPAGRVLVTEQPSLLEGELGALLAGAALLQSLTLGLTLVRGTNPDLIRREETLYREAARFGKEASTDW